ncbi:MAG: T9SS type A sorting domain-containing protein [Bacteroidetes bacterium]|nr:T9SS type A sorting domain-containing protein [Bacteroidota bacterium]
MKKQLFSLGLVAMAAITGTAQVTGTVSMGAGYANNKWYSLANGEVGTQPANNWDIALAATANPSNPLTAAALMNIKAGSLYEAAGIPVSKFDTLSTFNTSWTVTPLYNSDITWSDGAFNQASTGGSDYGYGSYNMSSHSIVANKIFVIKYTNGDFRKLYITLNTMAGTYTVVHDKLDNSDTHTLTPTISTYSTQNFLYIALNTNSVISREPASADWDLVFTQYTDNDLEYTVTGVLQNAGVKVAQVNGVSTATYVNHAAHTATSNINVIGYDWKNLGSDFVTWNITDSMVYFVQDKPGNIWKVVFTGFGGSSTGNFILSKQQLTAVGLADEQNVITKMAVYPNPANGNNVSLILSAEKNANASVSVIDLNGKVVSSENFEINAGLNQHALNTNLLNPGVYFIRLNVNGATATQKLIIQ